MTRGRILVAVCMLASSWVSAWDLQNVDWQKAASGGKQLFKAAAGLSDADEQKLGREVAANLAARYGLYEDPAREKYLQLVGQTLVERSSRPQIPYHFGILKSEEYNAFAAPGGYIFITLGLLTKVRDEAELAGVLAHEITHVTERHIVKAIRESNLFGAGQDFAAAVGHDPSAFGTMIDFTLNLFDKGLSRKDELEADRLAIQLTEKVGYDPRGLRDTITQLETLTDKTGALARFHSTHPPAEERLKVIDQILKKLPAKGARLADRYMKVSDDAVICDVTGDE